MKILLAIFTSLLLAASAFGQGWEKCFENAGLKDKHQIQMMAEGGKLIDGEFRVIKDYDEDNVGRYPFTGTASGNSLSIKFTSSTPEGFASSPTTKKWMIVKVGGKDVLRVTLYGKNNTTGKVGSYTVDYKACASPYDAAAANAKRITFAKGTSSATLTEKFTSQSQKYSYWLNLRAGQSISVFAPGCGISFFYPNKTPYEEGTEIDTWGTEKLTQTGDYLFSISPAGEPGTCTIKFEVK